MLHRNENLWYEASPSRHSIKSKALQTSQRWQRIFFKFFVSMQKCKDPHLHVIKILSIYMHQQLTSFTDMEIWSLIIIIMIMIALILVIGAIGEFKLQSPHCATNCLQHVRSSGQGAIVCKSCATHWLSAYHVQHVVCHLVRRDNSAIKFDRV